MSCLVSSRINSSHEGVCEEKSALPSKMLLNECFLRKVLPVCERVTNQDTGHRQEPDEACSRISELVGVVVGVFFM